MTPRFCTACGAPLPSTGNLHPTCTGCGHIAWQNPIPVAVLLQPVVEAGQTGLLVIRRGIDPGRGLLALPGGFIEAHETWQQSMAREAWEEAGIEVDPTALRPRGFVSTSPRPSRLLLFAEAPPVEMGSLPIFSPGEEAMERGIVFGPEGLEALFAFPLHAEAAAGWFRERRGQRLPPPRARTH